jgi:hypothetical protein
MKIIQNVDQDGVTFEHPDDGFSRKYTWHEIREAWVIHCETCGAWLGSLEMLVESMDDGIAKAKENRNPVEREQAIDALRKTRALLLHG